MSVETSLHPVLWREADWRGALERLRRELSRVPTSPPAQRAALELGRAFEYIEPDRTRAIAAYALAGAGTDIGRSRELATEAGWWRARARLSLAARVVDGDPRLILDEAEAWWDAGERALSAQALAELRNPDPSLRELDLQALVSGVDLADRADAAATRAEYEIGLDASDSHVMAARLAAAAGADARPHLEAALVATPGHAVAARLLLDLALRERGTEAMQRYLQLRVGRLEGTAWIDAMRASALTLIESEPHRGFGLRLLRQALERAYEQRHTSIPGHLAMWTTLVAHATADGTRRELLPLALQGIECTVDPVDLVWLGVLATEITLRDARNAVVAGAYAEIVAEHAPAHPVLAELVSAIAVAGTSAPAAAISAAVKVQEDVQVDIDLDGIYADVVGDSGVIDADAVEELPELEPEPEPQIAAPVAKVVPAKVEPTKVVPAKVEPEKPKPAPLSTALPKVAATPAPVSATKPAAVSTPVPTLGATPMSVSAAAPKAVTTPAVAISPVLPKIGTTPSVVAPKLAAKAAPSSGVLPKLGALPSLAKPAATTSAKPAAAPVLAALRAVERPLIPPKPEPPADAVPRARRIAMPIDIRLAVGGKTVEAHSRDISTSGLFILTSATLTIGGEHDIVLLLPGDEPFMEDELRGRARVARKADGGYGIELIAPAADLLARLAKLG